MSRPGSDLPPAAFAGRRPEGALRRRHPRRPRSRGGPHRRVARWQRSTGPGRRGRDRTDPADLVPVPGGAGYGRSRPADDRSGLDRTAGPRRPDGPPGDRRPPPRSPAVRSAAVLPVGSRIVVPSLLRAAPGPEPRPGSGARPHRPPEAGRRPADRSFDAPGPPGGRSYERSDPRRGRPDGPRPGTDDRRPTDRRPPAPFGHGGSSFARPSGPAPEPRRGEERRPPTVDPRPGSIAGPHTTDVRARPAAPRVATGRVRRAGEARPTAARSRPGTRRRRSSPTTSSARATRSSPAAGRSRRRSSPGDRPIACSSSRSGARRSSSSCSTPPACGSRSSRSRAGR